MAAVAAAVHANRQKEKHGHGHGHKHGHGHGHKAVQEEEDICRAPTLLGAAAAGWRRYQKPAAKLYSHIYVQVGVAGLIALNFLINIIQAQVAPKGDKYNEVFDVFGVFFNVAFLIELLLNMYGSWFRRFWKSGWNVFDFLVVAIGWMFQLNLPLPGPMKLLRMMRAFRVFRLFKRIASLRKIMNSLARAVPGVMNAFLIQLIFICIFAIIAVDRFRDYGEGGTYTNEGGDIVEFQTSRGQDYGFEYFGDFGKSLYTMFQVLTTESWSEAVARPMFNSNSATTSTGAAFFFVLFSILNGIILVNVVIAVLLEKMVDEEPAAEDTGDEDEDKLLVACTDTVNELTLLKKQVSHMANVTVEMQGRMVNVDIVKRQVAALLAHEGISK